MRVRPAACAAGFALILGLSGCGLPEGVDGDIGWPTPASAEQVVSKAGDCHTSLGEQIAPAKEQTVDCAASHNRETTYVGAFTGAAAAERKPPTLDRYSTAVAKAAQAEVYAECDRRTSEYVGHNWYHIRLRLVVAVPTDVAWQAGQHWYRCDLVEVDLGVDAVQAREGSLKGATLPATCLAVPASGTAKVVPCGERHNSEYAGTFLAPQTSKEVVEPDYESLHTTCRTVAASFLGVRAAQVAGLTGTYLWFDNRSDYNLAEYWIMGRRLVHCLLWFGTGTMTGSARGNKGRDLP